ncbi:MAG TPA: hypothetical protein VHR35_01365 [Nocardioides sp.]|nr:hypothetical protein [Nocardioides sp.]
MSSTQPTPPGVRGQQGARMTFRVVGLLLPAAALGLLAVGPQDLFSTGDSFEGPHTFWMVFVGLLMLGAVGWCLQAVAGETTPVIQASEEYLCDGQGILGVARIVDDGDQASSVTGSFFSRCGVRNDADASFCDGRGAALAR